MIKAKVATMLIPTGLLKEELKSGKTVFYFSTHEMMDILRISYRTAHSFKVDKPRIMWLFNDRLFFSRRGTYEKRSKYNHDHHKDRLQGTAIFFYRVNRDVPVKGLDAEKRELLVEFYKTLKNSP